MSCHLSLLLGSFKCVQTHYQHPNSSHIQLPCTILTMKVLQLITSWISCIDVLTNSITIWCDNFMYICLARALLRCSWKLDRFYCRDLKRKQTDLPGKLEPDKTAIQRLKTETSGIDDKRKAKAVELGQLQKQEKQLKLQLKDILKARSHLAETVSETSAIFIILGPVSIWRPFFPGMGIPMLRYDGRETVLSLTRRFLYW